MYQVIVNGVIRKEFPGDAKWAKKECDAYLIQQGLSHIDGETGVRTLNEGVHVNIHMDAHGATMDAKFAGLG